MISVDRNVEEIVGHYQRKLVQTNNLYMDLSAMMLQLEQREREIARWALDAAADAIMSASVTYYLKYRIIVILYYYIIWYYLTLLSYILLQYCNIVLSYYMALSCIVIVLYCIDANNCLINSTILSYIVFKAVLLILYCGIIVLMGYISGLL